MGQRQPQIPPLRRSDDSRYPLDTRMPRYYRVRRRTIQAGTDWNARFPRSVICLRRFLLCSVTIVRIQR